LRKFLSLVAASVLISAEAAALEKIQVTVPSVASNIAQLIAAQDKGYFREEGFDVEFSVAAGAAATSALISGSVPYSAAPSSAVTAILRGADLKIILISHSRAPYTLRSLVPEIKTLADMKGKMVNITTRGGTQEIAVIMLLDKHGLPRDHVGFSPMGFGAERIAGLLSGTQHIAILSRSDAGQLRDAGKLSQGHLLSDVNKELILPTGGLAITTQELAANRERARKFLRAAWKGTQFIMTHREATYDLMQKRTPRASRATIVEDVDGAVEDLDSDGEAPLDEAQKELAVRAEMMKIPADKVTPAEKVYDFSLIREVIRELRDWKPTL
jgi:NitT/TauT family transport system substrate-binding protein